MAIFDEINFMENCSVFKDEKEPKNLYLKEVFASQRSPKRLINDDINKNIIAPKSFYYTSSLRPKSSFRYRFHERELVTTK